MLILNQRRIQRRLLFRQFSNAERKLLIETKRINVRRATCDVWNYLFHRVQTDWVANGQNSFASLWARIICITITFLQRDKKASKQ